MSASYSDAGVPEYTFDSYDDYLATTDEDIEFELRGHGAMPWDHFTLNSHRLRGSAFLMRGLQRRWSEVRLVQAINATASYFALPYGPSGTAPEEPLAFELYFERLAVAGMGDLKCPDLLVFRRRDKPQVDAIVASFGGVAELPFVREDDERIRALVALSILAVEAENSLWRASKMPQYNVEPKPQKRLDGRLGFAKLAVLPTVILKEEDLAPLRNRQRANGVPIRQWHVFFDVAYGIAFDDVERLIGEGLIEPTRQVFQAPGGPTTEKTIYKVYYTYAYPLAEAVKEPTLAAAYLEDRNGHILPYVKFAGGDLRVSSTALNVLDAAATAHFQR